MRQALDHFKGISMIRILLATLLFLIACSTQASEQPDEQIAPSIDPNQELLDAGLSTIAEIEKQRDGFELLVQQINAASGDNKIALEFQFQERALITLDLLFELSDILMKQVELELDTTELRDSVVTYFISYSNSLDRIIDLELEKNVQRRSENTEFTGFALVQFERTISDKLEWIQSLFKKKMRILRELDQIEVDSSNHLENLRNRLIPYADNLYGQVQLIAKEKDAFEQSVSDEPPSAEIRSKTLAMKIRNTSTLGALSAVVNLLDENEIDSTRYRQLLLQTGEVSTDLFNPRIVIGILTQQATELLESARDNTGYFITQVILFLVILGFFKLLANATNYLMSRSFESRRVETSRLMQEMLLSLSNRGIMILGFLVALSQLGVQITAFLTGIGIAGFIVGFALQDSLANFAAGIMILGYRPFDVDDTIESGGVVGKVAKMSLVSTTILTFDNQTLIVPNNRIWGDVIKNITLQDKRRIDMEFRVAYDENIDTVKTLFKNIIESHEKILEDPSPTIEMDQLSPYAMVFVVRPWVERADYWSTKWELLRMIKEKLDSEGIKIPVLNQGVIGPA
jgi:small conductance mechanosensitive channel